MNKLLNDEQLIERIFDHIDNRTTDLGNEVWREPSSHYICQNRFEVEIELMKGLPLPFCPSAAIGEKGSYLARRSLGTPILVVRDTNGVLRAFINACRHRGMPVAEGSGCARAFVCPYHAWSYALDGKLRNIADEHGFPGVDPQEHGLIQISVREKGGLVYVQQEGDIDEEDLQEFPDFFSQEQVFFDQDGVIDNTNWKLIAETTMEGYHIKGLHKDTFYPFGLDNTNVVELFGPNSRVVFPFRRFNDLREVEPQDRDVTGLVTTVYNLFPNSVVSVLSKHTTLTIFDPIKADQTEIVSYRLTNQRKDGSIYGVEEALKDADFVRGAGFEEDRAAAEKIQQTVNAGRAPYFTFGLFEQAIVHFHKELENRLDSSSG